MDLKEIKELIALMRRNDLSLFEMEKEGFRIKLKKGGDPIIVSSAAPGQLTYAPAPAALPATAAPAANGAPAAEAAAGRDIVSPMVGTFYGSPSPEAAAFVGIGSEVTEDTVVCIIEAMKVMNEIKAETRGIVTEIVGENGKPVQYGPPLFRLK